MVAGSARFKSEWPRHSHGPGAWRGLRVARALPFNGARHGVSGERGEHKIWVRSWRRGRRGADHVAGIGGIARGRLSARFVHFSSGGGPHGWFAPDRLYGLQACAGDAWRAVAGIIADCNRHGEVARVFAFSADGTLGIEGLNKSFRRRGGLGASRSASNGNGGQF
jgi:hypothetical protein